MKNLDDIVLEEVEALLDDLSLSVKVLEEVELELRSEIQNTEDELEDEKSKLKELQEAAENAWSALDVWVAPSDLIQDRYRKTLYDYITELKEENFRLHEQIEDLCAQEKQP
jgi:hypothetical protein